MKIIKIKEDHFIIVDDSEIKVNDWYYLPRTNSAYECKEDPTELNLERSFGVAKITHSTQPIESLTIPGTYNGPVWNKIKEIPLSEVKGLIGETDKPIYHNIKPISLQEVKELIGEKSWKGYIDGTEWEVEIVDGKLKLK